MAQLKDLLVNGKSRFIDKIYASDQFISKVAQGTEPFLVDSSTWVENLNVDLLDGYHADDLIAGSRNYIVDLRTTPQTFNPNYLKDIVFISETDYSSLVSNGTITKNGITHTYSSSNWYITDKIPEDAEHASAADYATTAGVADTISVETSNNLSSMVFPTFVTSGGATASMKIASSLRFYAWDNDDIKTVVQCLYLGDASQLSPSVETNLLSDLHHQGCAALVLDDVRYGITTADSNLRFISNEGGFYFYDTSIGKSIHNSNSWTSTQIYAGEFMGNIEWDNILNKPASATGAYGYIGKTPVQDTSTQENLIGIGDSSFNGVLNIKGKQGNYTQGIRIYDAGTSSPHNISSLWFRAKRDAEYDAGMIGLTADDTGLRFRLPASTAGTTPNDYMNILYGGNVGIGATSPSEKLQVAGTIYSSVAHGTAPLKVDSSTLVAKLNVDLLDSEHASDIHGMSKSGTHLIYSTDPYFLDSSFINSTATFFGYTANTSIVDTPVPGCPTNKALLYTTYKTFNTPYYRVIPGSKVCVDCWMMRETGSTGTARSFSFQVKTYTSTGTVCTSTNVPNAWRIAIPQNSVWQKYTYSIDIPSNANQFNVYLEFNYNGTGIPTYFGGLHIYYQDLTSYYLVDRTWGDNAGRLATPIVYKHGRTYASNANAGWKKIATWTTETLTTERKSKISFFVSGSPKYTGLSKADGILTLSVCWAANSIATSTPSVMSAIWDLATTDLADSPNINPENFVLTWKINTTGEEGSEVYTATMNLYCYRPKDYSSYSFQVIDETSENGYPADFWTLYNNTGANTTIPAEETQVVSKIGAIQAPIIYKHGRGHSANVANFFWKKVADWTTASLTSERACKISFYVSGGYHWGRINGILTANVRWASGSTATSSPAQAELSWDFANSTIGNHDVPINLNRFVLTWKINTTGDEGSEVYTATMKIYFYLDRGYTSFSFTKIEEHDGYGTPVDYWKLYSINGGTAANSSTNLPTDETIIYSKASLIQNPTLGDYAKDKGIVQLYSTDPLFDAEVPGSYFNAAGLVDAPAAGCPVGKVLRYTSKTSLWSPYIYVQRGRSIRFEVWLMRLTTASGTAGNCILRIHRFDKNKNKVDANSYFNAFTVVPPKTGVWEKYTYNWKVNESGAEYPTPDPDNGVESTYKGDGIGWIRIQMLINDTQTAAIETFLGGIHAYYNDIIPSEVKRGINEIYSTDYELLNLNVGQTYLPNSTANGNISGTVVKTPVGGSPVSKVVLFGATQRTSVQSFTPNIAVQPGKTILVEVWLMRLSTAGNTNKNWNFQLYQFGKNVENIAATTYITMSMTSDYDNGASTNLSPARNSKWTRYTYLYKVPVSGAPYEASGYEGDGVHWIRFAMTANAAAASGNTPTYFGGLHVSYVPDLLDNLHASEIKALPNTGILEVFSTDSIFNDPMVADSSLWGGTIVNNPASIAGNQGPSGKVLMYVANQGHRTITDFIPVQPGKTIRIEVWLMRLAGSSGTSRNSYISVWQYDKSKNAIAGTTFTYHPQVNNWAPTADSKWYKRVWDYTVPTSGAEYPTPNPDADPPVESTYKGDGVYYIKFGIIGNNGGSGMATYLGGIHAYYLMDQDPIFRDTLVSYAPTYAAAATWTYPGGSYASVANPNIRLLGDSSYGLSTIEFISAKGDTSINRPADCAFIQFQPYGTTTQSAIGTQPTLAGTGEVNRLVIGVNNDTNDRLILQTPNGDGLRHAVATNNYMIWDEGNDGSDSGLDADLLDGQHGSYYAIATHNHDSSYAAIGHNHDSSYLKPSQVTGVVSLELSTSEATYLTVGSTQYKIKLPATNPYAAASLANLTLKNTAGTAVTYNGSSAVDLSAGVYYATTAGSTTTTYKVKTVGTTATANHYLTFVPANNASLADSSLYTTAKAYIQPSTGNIITSGYVAVGTGGTNSYIASDSASNIFLRNSSGAVLVCDAKVVRRGTSLADVTLGNSSYPWAALYTKQVVIDSSAAGAIAHISYNRASYNYINIPTNGKLGVSVNGAAAANLSFMVTSAAVTPGEKNGTIDLGSSSYYWKNVYTRKVTIDSSTAGNTAHIQFNRTSFNYIQIPTGGTFAVCINSTGGTNTFLAVDASAVYPGYHTGTVDLGKDASMWGTVYATGFATANNLIKEDASGRISIGSKPSHATAKGLNVGDLLVSSAWADRQYVPTNGIYSKGQIRSGVAQGTAPLVVDSSTQVSNLKSTFSQYADVLRDPVYYRFVSSNLTSGRRTSGNVSWADGGLHYFLATRSMTTGKPAGDGHILHMSWDNGSYEGQFVLPTSSARSLQWRAQNSGTWSSWITVLDSSNSSVSGDNSSTLTVTLNGVSKSLTVASPTSVTGVSSLELSTTAATYLTVGSTEYKIKLPATNPYSISDVQVTQTATTSSNTSWRPLLLGIKYSDNSPFSITTDTSTAFATHLAKFKPSTGELALGGLYKMKTDGTVDASVTDTTVFNANGGTIETNLFVNGTQTSATNNWKGNLPANCNISALYDGMTIYYRLPVAGNSTAAKLQLYKADGTTTVGSNCSVYGGTTALTTQYGANSIIRFTYYNGVWRGDCYYNTNTWRGIYAAGTSVAGTDTETYAMNFTAGAGMEVSSAARGTGSGQSGSTSYFNITYKNTGVLSVDSSGTDLRINYADTLTLLAVPCSNQVKTVDISTGNDYYLTFVDSHNATAAAENLYTNAGLLYRKQSLFVGNTAGITADSSHSIGVVSFRNNMSSTVSTELSLFAVENSNIMGYGSLIIGEDLSTGNYLATCFMLAESSSIYGNSNYCFTFGLSNQIGSQNDTNGRNNIIMMGYGLQGGNVYNDSSSLFIIGRRNVEIPRGVFIIGDGSTNTSNLLELDASGNFRLYGQESKILANSFVPRVTYVTGDITGSVTIEFDKNTIYYRGLSGTSAATISFTWANPTDGQEKHVILKAGSLSSPKVITIGSVNNLSNSTYKNVETLTVQSNAYAEISILYLNGGYFIRANV